jgi:hypothetical protein
MSTNYAGGESIVALAGFEVKGSMHGMPHIAESEIWFAIRQSSVRLFRLSPCE